MKGKQLRIGIAGCGWAGGMHADDLQKLSWHYTITASCDPVPVWLKEFAVKYGVPLGDVPVSLPRFAGQYEAFFSSLVNDKPLPVTLDDARASIELITALYQSSETGAAVNLPIGPGHPKYHGWISRPARPSHRKVGATT